MMKVEFAPLLSLGFHPLTMADLRVLCVDSFPNSLTRTEIMAGLEKIIGNLSSENVKGEVWIDGSFLTQKQDPEDSDIVLYFDGEFYDSIATPTQRNCIDWLKTDLKPGYKCDSYILAHYPPGHRSHDQAEWFKSYWIRQFGFSRADSPKGLAVIQL